MKRSNDKDLKKKLRKLAGRVLVYSNLESGLTLQSAIVETSRESKMYSTVDIYLVHVLGTVLVAGTVLSALFPMKFDRDLYSGSFTDN